MTVVLTLPTPADDYTADDEYCYLDPPIPPEGESNAERKLKEDLQKERDSLVSFCRSWLRPHDEGDEYYRFSLTPAACWDAAPVHGGEQDRRYRVSITEADLHIALSSLPPMYRRFGHLWRGSLWSATRVWEWDTALGREFGAQWIAFRDTWLNPGEAPTYKVRLMRVFNKGRQFTAEQMADFLGVGWLRG